MKQYPIASLEELEKILSPSDYKIMEQLSLLGLYQEPQFNCLINLMNLTHQWFLDGRLNKYQYGRFIQSLLKKALKIQAEQPLRIAQ